MKTTGKAILGILALLLLISLYLGLLFGLSIVISGVGSLFYAQIFLPYLLFGLKVYAVLASFTFVILLTFRYQNCCVGMNTFRGHIRHSIGEIATEDILMSVIWPWGWYVLDRNFSSWGLPWGEIVFQAFCHWLITSWRGVELVTINFRTGEPKTTYIKNPDQAREVLVKDISETLK